MALYFGPVGPVTVKLSGTGVYQMPYEWVVVTGLTPPAAAPGTKTLAAKARMRMQAVSVLAYIKNLDGILNQHFSVPFADLDNGRVYIENLTKPAYTKYLPPRSELTVLHPPPTNDVTYIGAGTAVTSTGGMGSVTPPTRNVGDFLLCVWGMVGGGTIASSAGGWSQATSNFATGDFRAFYRFATNDANDNWSYVHLNPDGTTLAFAQIFNWRNVDPTFPFLDRGYRDMAGNGDFNNNVEILHAYGAPSTSAATMNVGDIFDYVNYSGSNGQWAQWLVPFKRSQIFCFMKMPINNTAGSPSLTAATVTPANTTAEANTFPMTLIANTNNGTGLNVMGFRSAPLTVDSGAYAAGGTWNYTISAAPVEVNSKNLTGGLRPIGAYQNSNVYLDNLLKTKFTLTGDLTSSHSHKDLDGILHQKYTVTCDLHAIPGKMLDGLLGMRWSFPSAFLYDPHPFDTTLKMRWVGNVTHLTVGTTHMPQALLRQKWTLSGPLTTNYMQAHLLMPWRSFCNLDVNVKLGLSAAMHWTASLSLARAPGAGGALGSMHWTGTMRLTLPLAAITRMHWTGIALAGVQRRVAGSAAERYSALPSLSVVRTFGASLGVRQTAVATLTSVRTLTAHAAMRMSASAGLSSSRWLAGFGGMHWRAVLDGFVPIRPVLPPVTDITVNPDMPVVDSESLPVQVESPDAIVDVEEA